MTDEKVRENRLRRVAERRGFRMEKSRRRDPKAIDYGRFMLIDNRRNENTPIMGVDPHAYSATLDDIEKYLEHLRAGQEEALNNLVRRMDMAKAADRAKPVKLPRLDIDLLELDGGGWAIVGADETKPLTYEEAMAVIAAYRAGLETLSP